MRHSKHQIELKLEIDYYIHFYNLHRYQKRLNGLSPLIQFLLFPLST
ncbi:IS3 family transposase [Lysinibacillus sp. NPDC056232]